MLGSPLFAGTAALMSDSDKTIGYAALERRSIQFANLLRDEGLRPGDRVAILLENRLEWFVAMWGVRRAEMFFVPINWHLKTTETAHFIANSDARAVLTSAALLDLAVAALDSAGPVQLRLAVGVERNGFRDFDAALDRQSDRPRAPERDGGAMPYSSGTTGQPKGILRPLTGAPFGTPSAFEAMLSELYSIDVETVYLSPAPQYHSAPIGFAGTVLVRGGTIVAMPKFDAEGVLEAIARHRITHAQFVPTHFVRMLRLEEEVRARYDLSSLKMVIHAAAPCALHVKRAMIEWLGPIVHEYYAGSERCGMTAIDSPEWLARPGSVGRCRSGGAIRILDMETGAELPTGEIGTVYFETPTPFEYHKDRAKTAATFDEHGWGTHHDIGHLDADGYLFLTDRRADLILSGGVNIYPQEIEDVLTAHPAVADAGVIGEPDAEFGQRVIAFVELLPGAASGEADLIAHVRTHLAHFKAPRRIVFLDSLPRLPSGKLLRRRLMEEIDSDGLVPSCHGMSK